MTETEHHHKDCRCWLCVNPALGHANDCACWRCIGRLHLSVLRARAEMETWHAGQEATSAETPQ